MAQIKFTIGFIPVNWEGNSEGKKRIQAGDTDYNKCLEMVYSLGESEWKNLSFNTLLPEANSASDMIKIYKAIGADCSVLSENFDAIPSSVMENILALCQEEADFQDSFIDIFESGIDFFDNNRKKYNGCFYCHYTVCDEEDDTIENEFLFVIKRK